MSAALLPDDTHFEIALACVKRGVHVMVTKPVVKTLVSLVHHPQPWDTRYFFRKTFWFCLKHLKMLDLFSFLVTLP
jgi:hypothetical protein